MFKPELLICDFDGVLIDSELLGCRMWSDMLTALDMPVSVESMLNDYTGKSSPQICRQIENDYGYVLPSGFLDEVNRAVENLFETNLKAVEGVPETLEKIKMPLCIASGSRPERLFQCLRVTKLDRFFGRENVFSSHEVRHGKPAPDIFLYAAEKMNASADRCVVVEDSVSGVRAGKAAGMRVLGFAGASHCGPEHGRKLTTAGADLIFRDFSRLPEILNSPDV